MSLQADTTLHQPSDALDSRERLMARLRSLKSLPTTVAVAVRLFQLQKAAGDPNRDPQPADYARIMATDAGMTARILALANSSYFGLSVRITQPTVAVNLLGIAAVRILAINFCLSGLHHELKLTRPESRHFWEASLCKAVAARELARRLNPAAAEDAYVAGLFQDIALPVIFATHRDLMGPLLESRLSVPRRLQRERALFEANHAELGALFARSLGLPEAQAQLIAAHHDLGGLRATGESTALAAGAYAAALFPHRLDHWDGADVEALRDFLARQAGEPIDLEEFLGAVSQECRREFAYFDRANVTEIRLLELMADALSQASQSAEGLIGEVAALKQQVACADEEAQRSAQDRDRLADAAARDPLTGLLNRAGFEQECRPALTAAHQNRQPVAMLYLDMDRFKAINDLFGHAAGDDALRQVVAVLRECTRKTDILGRIGGDEFAILLPNCPRNKSVEIGERIRARVAGRRAESHPLSISVGVRCAMVPQAQSLDALLTASDQRMYAAKRAGGNNISVEVS